MERDTIINTIQEIVRDFVDNDEIVLEEQMTATDIEGWTSLSQAQILSAIEQKLRIRFSLKEIIEMKSIGQIVEAVASKINQ